MRIAVIGSGISGLASAWLLHRRHDVRVFEKQGRLGGHTHTVLHSHHGRQLALDTGFIVFNHSTYPNLTRFFARLEVMTQPSDMSFSVSCPDPDLEYAVHSVRGLFAQPSNLVSFAFMRMLVDIVRFGRRGRKILAGPDDPAPTIGDFLSAGNFSETFANYYLLPMTAAIWSSGTQLASSYPRDALLKFLANHGLLQVTGQPEWRTVSGGSHAYVREIAAALEGRIHLDARITTIVRRHSDVELHMEDGSVDRFDHVVIATHADQALGLLNDPADDERELLGRWTYSRNRTWLHTDTSLLPRRRSAWASWNYLLPGGTGPQHSACVTYHLNRLQRLEDETQFLVTLNPPHEPAAAKTIRHMTYTHPIYTRDSVATQSDLPRLNGRRRTHFCGAYFGNGFHEDGLNSAIAVADDLGVPF